MEQELWRLWREHPRPIFRSALIRYARALAQMLDGVQNDHPVLLIENIANDPAAAAQSKAKMAA
jgi:hypothetical protein